MSQTKQLAYKQSLNGYQTETAPSAYEKNLLKRAISYGRIFKKINMPNPCNN